MSVQPPSPTPAQSKSNRAVVVILVVIAIHDLNLASRHTDTIMLLNGGYVAGLGSFNEVVCEEALRTVYGIEAELLRASNGQTVVLPLCAAAH